MKPKRFNDIVFDKHQTTIIKCPESKAGNYIIPNNILFIEQEAFKNCVLLSSIWHPDSILSIGYGAFKACCGLVSINIPSKIIYIYNDVLNGCTNLKEIHIHCIIPPKCISNNYPTCIYDDELMLINRPIFYEQLNKKMTCFKGINKANCKLYVPIGSLPKYREAVGWREFENIIEEMI